MAGITFGLHLQARTLQPVTAVKDKSQWMVATTSLRNDNEVRLLEYDPDQESLKSIRVLAHPEEIWDLASCPSSSDQFVTVHSKGGTYGATLWRAEPSGQGLAAEAHLKHEGIVRRALWNQHATDMLITLEESAIRKWQLSPHGAQCVASAMPGELQHLWSGSLHPKKPGLAATVAGNNIQVWDLNNVAKVGEVSNAHRMPARDVDWSPNNEHRLVTGGDDCKLRFWDTRMLSKPEALLELGGHSHWVWKTRFSPFHDQMLVSSSSDSTVCLWYTPHLAKKGDPRDTKSPIPGNRQEGDGKVHTYDEHEDSVYGLSWSVVDPWVFASLSYDGRVLINKVPKNVKYKILI
eukprot:jgi/Chrzof1/1532/Cz10g11120.t1